MNIHKTSSDNSLVNSALILNKNEPLGCTPLNAVPILFCVKAYSKNSHFRVFIMIKIGQTRFPERLCLYPSDRKPFCGWLPARFFADWTRI